MVSEIEKIRKKTEQTTQIDVCEGIPVIRYDLLSALPGVVHGFSTRMGGVSEGCFERMNLSFARGDDEEKVMENFRRFGAAIGVSVSQMVFTDQTHTDHVRVVSAEDRGKGILRARDYRDVDGLVTDAPDVCLVAFFADCVPLIFVDPIRRVIGLSHSGWRGTAKKIGRRTVQRMCGDFGCRPEDIIAAIGPSICRDCYEVSADVAEVFAGAFSDSEYRRIVTEKEDGKYLLDLWQANAFVLQDAGIRREHIAMPDICTCCNGEMMWSHRWSGARRGSLAAFLMLRE